MPPQNYWGALWHNRLLLTALLAAIMVFTALVVALPATGQQQAERGISISPLTFEFRLDPGQEVSDEIRVFNAGSEPIFATVQIEDTTATGERGQAVISEAGTTTYSVASWTILDQDVIEVQPGEQRVIPFTVRVPEDAEPGGHYGAITVENVPQAGISGSGAVFAQKVAALMLVAVSGEVDEEVTLTDFFISTEQTKFRYDWIPTNWIIDPTEVTFVMRFENTGSVHLKPAGFVTVTSPVGGELAKLPLEQRNVLPDSARIVEMTWRPEGLTMGKIRAEVNAIFGSKNEPLFAAAEFWVVPIATLGPWVLGGLLALMLVLLFRKRLALALRVMIKGDAGGATAKPKKREGANGGGDSTPPTSPAPPTGGATPPTTPKQPPAPQTPGGRPKVT